MKKISFEANGKHITATTLTIIIIIIGQYVLQSITYKQYVRVMSPWMEIVRFLPRCIFVSIELFIWRGEMWRCIVPGRVYVHLRQQHRSMGALMMHRHNTNARRTHTQTEAHVRCENKSKCSQVDSTRQSMACLWNVCSDSESTAHKHIVDEKMPVIQSHRLPCTSRSCA